MPYRTPEDVQKRKDAKRRLILDTAARVFARKGYHDTAIKDILDEAGISTGSFYFYFHTKEDVFKTLCEEVHTLSVSLMRDAMNTMVEQPVESVCKAFTFFLLALQRDRPLARIMLLEADRVRPYFGRREADRKREAIEQTVRIFDELQGKGIISTPNTRVAALAFWGSIASIMIDWLREEEPVRPIVEWAFPLVVYNLQALGIAFDGEEVKRYVDGLVQQYDACHSDCNGWRYETPEEASRGR